MSSDIPQREYRTMSRRWTIAIGILLSALIGTFTNIATGTLSDDWKPYLWLSWLLMIVCILAMIFVEWRAARQDAQVQIGISSTEYVSSIPYGRNPLFV